MYIFEHQIRVRYAETDQMGYVYYGNYAAYLEVARVESFRNLGLSYKKLEESGIMMPVLEYKTKYIRPAKYDDLLTIKLIMKQKPSTRILFEYEIYNEDKILLNTSETTLVFVSTSTGKPSPAPELFLKIFEQHF
ncbi:MAG: acyl-CoA thioesterase [Cytophagales bacterium]|nr:MAG: acyl-CoA thioesterase [Cytophagales bacterium]